MPNLSYIFHKYFRISSWRRKGFMVRFFRKNEKVVCVLRCLLVSYVLTGLMMLLLAFLLYKFSLPKQVVGIGIILIYIISTFVGGLLMGKSMKVKKYIWGLVLGMSYFLLLIVISLIANGGNGNASDNFFLTMILCGGSGMLGGMLS